MLHQPPLLRKPKPAASSLHSLTLDKLPYLGQPQNNFLLGQHGRYRSNVWNYAGANCFGRKGDAENPLGMHPTVKPIAMVADALMDCSDRGDIVLDTFLGSGTTLLAAERVKRVCYAMELDPLYVDLAIRRWQQHSGGKAIHAATSRNFDDIANEMQAKNGAHHG